MESIRVITVIALLADAVTGQYITLYAETNFKGQAFNESISGCQNLPGMQVNSVNTRNNCARLWDNRNCGGNSIEVMPRSPGHANLAKWGFGNRTLSVGPCRDSCDLEVTGTQPKESFPVILYSAKNFTNGSLRLNVTGCTALYRFHESVASVKTLGQCTQLWSTVDCTVRQNKPDDTIELRVGTPDHEDIMGGWHMKKVMSVSHCRYKCNDGKMVTLSTRTLETNTLPIMSTAALNETETITFENETITTAPHDMENISTITTNPPVTSERTAVLPDDQSTISTTVKISMPNKNECCEGDCVTPIAAVSIYMGFLGICFVGLLYEFIKG